MTAAMAMAVPICAMAAPRTVPLVNSFRSSMGAAVRRSCRTKARPAARAPRIEPMVGAEVQPWSTPLVSE